MARISRYPQSEPKVDDGYLIALAKLGDRNAYDRLVRRYHGFVRLKASSYFLAGGDSDDLIQEGLVGLYKAIRDFRTDRESSFRNFAELCITRQIITAVKTATRNKHTPLNQYVSFSSTPAGAGDDVPTLDQILPGSTVHDPVNQVISSEELRSLVGCLSSALSELEGRVLSLYLDGYSYEQVGERLDCDTKTVDNALQRVKRKVGAHLQARAWRGLSLLPKAAPARTAVERRWLRRSAAYSCPSLGSLELPGASGLINDAGVGVTVSSNAGLAMPWLPGSPGTLMRRRAGPWRERVRDRERGRFAGVAGAAVRRGRSRASRVSTDPGAPGRPGGR